jgi:hypothetical protein
MHIPVNHPLRPLYRAFSGLTGVYLLVVGLVGFVQSRGADMFARDDLPWVLGVRVNPAFALLAIVIGGLLVAVAMIGRNLDHYVNIGAAIVLIVVATAMMTFIQTDANVLAFSMANCIALYLVGMVNLAAGLYGKVGSGDSAKAEEAFRHR